MNYAKEHNLYPKNVAPHFATVDSVFVREQISFDQLNMWLGIDKEDIEFLNPQYKLEIIPAIAGQPQYLVLPRQTMGLFVDNEDSLYVYAKEEFKNDRSKMPNSKVAGQASVLIFPDLNTGNNTYKAIQRETGALAIGPMLQGLNKPVNDLSRGCTVDDIFNTVLLTAIQANQK